MKLDDRDRIIITRYATNPDISQDEIAREISLSQPSVAARIRKLKKIGAIETQTGINPFKMGLQMAKVDVTSRDPSKIMELFQGCPYFMNGFIVSGRSNLSLFFVAEQISTLEAIVDGHLRKMAEVQDVEFNIVISPEKKVVMPVQLSWERNGKAPCKINISCKDCESFKTGRCTGCPIIVESEGWLF